VLIREVPAVRMLANRANTPLFWSHMQETA